MITGYCTHSEHHNCKNTMCDCQCHRRIYLAYTIREGDHVFMFSLKNTVNPSRFGTVGTVVTIYGNGAVIRFPILRHSGSTVDCWFADSSFTLLGRTR